MRIVHGKTVIIIDRDTIKAAINAKENDFLLKIIHRKRTPGNKIVCPLVRDASPSKMPDRVSLNKFSLKGLLSRIRCSHNKTTPRSKGRNRFSDRIMADHIILVGEITIMPRACIAALSPKIFLQIKKVSRQDIVPNMTFKNWASL